MIKNKFIMVFAVALIFTPLFMIKAEETSAIGTNTSVTTTSQDIKVDPAQEKIKADEMKAKLKIESETLMKNLIARKTEIEKKINDNRTEKKIKLEAKAQLRVKTTLEKIFDKLTDQLGKLSLVDAKLSSIISGYEQKGKEVSPAKEQYVLAKAAVEKAKVEILADRMIALNQTTLQTSKGTIRDLVKTAEESIRAAGNEYRKIIPIIAQTNGGSEVENKTETKTTN